ncbi:hypothetical protein ACFQ0B_06320 [Nonomuraea thailandensis]
MVVFAATGREPDDGADLDRLLPALRAVIGECRRSDAASRPSAVDLVRILLGHSGAAQGATVHELLLEAERRTRPEEPAPYADHVVPTPFWRRPAYLTGIAIGIALVAGAAGAVVMIAGAEGGPEPAAGDVLSAVGRRTATFRQVIEETRATGQAVAEGRLSFDPGAPATSYDMKLACGNDPRPTPVSLVGSRGVAGGVAFDADQPPVEPCAQRTAAVVRELSSPRTIKGLIDAAGSNVTSAPAGANGRTLSGSAPAHRVRGEEGRNTYAGLPAEGPVRFRLQVDGQGLPVRLQLRLEGRGSVPQIIETVYRDWRAFEAIKGRRPMAEEFTANRQEAANVSRDLKAIRAALDGGNAGALDAKTGSEKVDDALRRFFEESSDNRERMNQLLERAAGLLDALVEGTGTLDGSLADSFRPARAARDEGARPRRAHRRPDRDGRGVAGVRADGPARGARRRASRVHRGAFGTGRRARKDPGRHAGGAPRSEDPTPDKGDFAGRVARSGALVALSVRQGKAVGYFCDGRREVWMSGAARDNRVTLTAPRGGKALMTAALDEDGATGDLVLGEDAFRFTAPVVERPSGLYRATGQVRGASVVGGWIVLPDGRQVGAVNVGGVERPAPRLVPGGEVLVDDVTLEPEPVDAFMEELTDG